MRLMVELVEIQSIISQPSKEVSHHQTAPGAGRTACLESHWLLPWPPAVGPFWWAPGDHGYQPWGIK